MLRLSGKGDAQCSTPPKFGNCDRDQGAQLCEATEAACDRLREINTEIAQSPCRPVAVPETQEPPTEPPAPPNPAQQTPTQR